jgi:hypothetical protein
MAIIHKCDACGAASPDAAGHNVVNDWYDVSIRNRTTVRRRAGFLVCDACMGNPKVEGVAGIAPLLRKLFLPMFEYFRRRKV